MVAGADTMVPLPAEERESSSKGGQEGILPQAQRQEAPGVGSVSS